MSFAGRDGHHVCQFRRNIGLSPAIIAPGDHGAIILQHQAARPARGNGQGPFGGAGWWRPPGWFSGPLLSNPQFRKLFLARVHELCQTTFTEERFGPVIQNLANKLRAELESSGRVAGQRMQPAELNRNIESFERQLVNRRKFLLKALAKEGFK